MIKKGKILTGGNISEHYPLGADNSALYSWAATFLKNLDLKDRSYSRYFAVPETNKTGSRIDWYCNGAYYQGDPLIVPWENADEPERTAALKELDGMMDGLAKMAERLRSKPGLSADMKLFVQFIAGDPEKGTGPMALETPGKKFIYIVEGHPVLTFWGFTEKGVETAGSDPFYFLRTPARSPRLHRLPSLRLRLRLHRLPSLRPHLHRLPGMSLRLSLPRQLRLK